MESVGVNINSLASDCREENEEKCLGDAVTVIS